MQVNSKSLDNVAIWIYNWCGHGIVGLIMLKIRIRKFIIPKKIAKIRRIVKNVWWKGDWLVQIAFHAVASIFQSSIFYFILDAILNFMHNLSKINLNGFPLVMVVFNGKWKNSIKIKARTDTLRLNMWLV